MIATMPRNRNETKQDYETPDEFFQTVNKYFPFVLDLAADVNNTKCERFYSEINNSFSHSWHIIAPDKWLWLNPPFRNIEPWAEKCLVESKLGANIVMLTPASTGTDWFRKYVFGKCTIIFFKGRLIFGGTKPNPKTGKPDQYPKDLMLTVWSNKIHPGIKIWNWRAESLNLWT